jgi:hypothetical protein
MKRTCLILVTFGIALMLTSCFVQRPISEAPSANNKTYEVSYLFEHDGCKVYRFYDQGHWVYFTNCKGEVTSIKADSTASRVVNIIKTQP